MGSVYATGVAGKKRTADIPADFSRAGRQIANFLADFDHSCRQLVFVFAVQYKRFDCIKAAGFWRGTRSRSHKLRHV